MVKVKEVERHLATVQINSRSVDARCSNSRDPIVSQPHWRSEVSVDGGQRQAVKDKATMPICVELVGNRQLEKRQVLSAGPKHAGALDIRILLHPMLNIAREEHRQQVFEGYYA